MNSSLSPSVSISSPMTISTTDLTIEQRRIVEWGDGPVVVIAGAGTGKTRVIVERVRHLLETHDGPPARAAPRPDLQRQGRRRARARGSSRPSGSRPPRRMTVSNFHSFCQRVLTEHAADAGLPAAPGRPRRRRPGAAAPRHRPGPRPRLPRDRLLDAGQHRQLHQSLQGRARPPADFDAFVAERAPRLRGALRRLRGGRRAARDRRATSSRSASVRGAYAGVRANERAEARGEEPRLRPGRRREGRRPRGPPNDRRRRQRPRPRTGSPPRTTPRIDALAATYVVDGAALEVLRLTELADRLPRLRGRSWRGAARSTSASRSPPSRSCSRPGPTSCAATSASTATSWSTSSRTPTSPRSSSSSCSAGRPIGPTTSWSSATTTSRSIGSGAPASPPSPSSSARFAPTAGARPDGAAARPAAAPAARAELPLGAATS